MLQRRIWQDYQAVSQQNGYRLGRHYNFERRVFYIIMQA